MTYDAFTSWERARLEYAENRDQQDDEDEEDEDEEHEVTITHDPTNRRYPYTPTCTCGWQSRPMLTQISAQIITDFHIKENQ